MFFMLRTLRNFLADVKNKILISQNASAIPIDEKHAPSGKKIENIFWKICGMALPGR